MESEPRMSEKPQENLKNDLNDCGTNTEDFRHKLKGEIFLDFGNINTFLKKSY